MPLLLPEGKSDSIFDDRVIMIRANIVGYCLIAGLLGFCFGYFTVAPNVVVPCIASLLLGFCIRHFAGKHNDQS